MEAAAKTVEVLSKRILPEKPHHLSFSPTWRHRPHPEEDETAESRVAKRRCEEWSINRLQYLTLLSEADRGTLLTRSYYDMREEPAKLPPREMSSLPKNIGTGEKKKLSLSDYKSKKTALVASASPSDPFSAGAKSKSHRDGFVSESRLPPKPASLPPRPPSPAGKRRIPDMDDDRAPKRPRPDERRIWDDRLQRERDDASRRKDKAPPPSRDPSAPVPSSSLLNGRSLLKPPPNSGRSTSPAGRSRGDPVNGVRPSVAGNNGSRGTPTKADTVGTKSFVPPLLSPLHLSFDSREKASALSKAKKPESTASTTAKKSRPTVSIPPLLSPTLPPTIEAELQRRKKATSDSSEERIRDGKDAVGLKKRPAATEDGVDDDVKPVPAPVKKLGHRRRLLVVLNVPRSLRPAFASIVGHAPEPKTEPHSLSLDRELDRKPRADGDDVAHQAPARKRPVTTAGALSAAETTATKRPRSTDLAANPKQGAPLTPARKTTAMSRVSSTNSVAQTPTGLASSTPLASVPMSASASTDRRPNGNEKVAAKGERLDVKLLREKEVTLMAVGSKLKHEADPILLKYRVVGNLPVVRDGPDEFKIKLAYVLSLESIIAFLLAFHAQNTYRAMYNKVGDIKGWNTMFPLMDRLLTDFRQNDVGNQQPLLAMLLLLYGVSMEEVIKCYVQYEDPGLPITLETLAQQERRKYRMWAQVHQANAAVQNPKVRVDVHPWSTLDDIADASLRVLRLWCAEENIDWAPDQVIRDNWPVKPAHDYSRR
ncbi:hypothetical protein E4U42_005355 [Claviceps africana]|uniref:Uncharacterized protein n=1 Tax=Claviceps africana TaxID=83212 RepID=A0A8K0J9Z6_9HYPO|nr:hypothetical protein E4U42_005355 [Claviceps africana]